jgi:hypothetical protein
MDTKVLNKTVSIFGAGIAGLSTAHDLVRRGYKVDLYEPLSSAGGLARSECISENSSGKGIPGEVSWRGYGPFYHNCFHLMQQTPLERSERTVYDNLSRPVDFIFTSKNGGESLIDKLTLFDRLRLYLEISRQIGACPERRQKYSEIKASNYLQSRMSAKGFKQFTNMFGPWVGIDPQRASLHHVMCFLKSLKWSGRDYLHNDKDGSWVASEFAEDNGCYSWSVFNSPTSDSWFTPWVNNLTLLGVNIYYGVGLESLSISSDGKSISGAVLTNGKSIVSDNYVCAIGPFQMRDICSRSPRMQLETDQFTKLTSDGEHLQVSFRLGFSELSNSPFIKWNGTRKALIISDSPFNITLYRQDDLWDNFRESYESNGIQALWSGTACVSYLNGLIYNKPLVELTKEEFKAEILAQLSSDVGFRELIKESTGINIDDLLRDRLVHFEVWHTFKFPEQSSISEPSEQLHNPVEPKFVDSYKTRKYQPTVKTRWDNLYFAGGHVRNTVELYSMEAASETGRRAANYISGQSTSISQPNVDGSNLLQFLDGLLYDIRGPSVIDVLLTTSVINLLIAGVMVFTYW